LKAFTCFPQMLNHFYFAKFLIWQCVSNMWSYKLEVISEHMFWIWTVSSSSYVGGIPNQHKKSGIDKPGRFILFKRKRFVWWSSNRRYNLKSQWYVSNGT
jgi:hypothetical protein